AGGGNVGRRDAKREEGKECDSNLQSLCWPCHKAKTARERLK
ncbi:HNH endonuclease, partial [Escherichia coli]